MRPLLPVFVTVLVLTAGCTGMLGANETETESRTVQTSTPTLTTKPMPGPPDTVSKSSIRTFVSSYERAYKWNEILKPTSTDIHLTVANTTIRNGTESGYVIHVKMSITHYYRPNGSTNTIVEDDFYPVYYFVNSTTVRRVEPEVRRSTTPDPRNGTVVESKAEQPPVLGS